MGEVPLYYLAADSRRDGWSLSASITWDRGWD